MNGRPAASIFSSCSLACAAVYPLLIRFRTTSSPDSTVSYGGRLISPEKCMQVRLLRDILPPLSLSLRSGGFLFDSPDGLSISRLTPRVPRFFIARKRAVFLFTLASGSCALPPGYSLLHSHHGPYSSRIRSDISARRAAALSSHARICCTSCLMGKTALL